MFCGKCGKKIKDGNTFCTGCGQKTDNERSKETLSSEHLTSIKELIDSVFALGDNLDPILKANGYDMPFKQIVQYELARYCAYLCSLNGVVGESEADFITTYLDLNVNPAAVRQLANSLDINDHSFTTSEPLSFQIVGSIEKKLERGSTGRSALVTVYDIVGKAILNYNETNEINIATKESHILYIRFLEKLLSD
jgi:hypothetical protein